MITLLFAAFSVFAIAQPGPIALGTTCNPDEQSPARAVSKAMQSIKNKDYPTAKVQLSGALRQDPNDLHALYLRGELSIRMRQLPVAAASWRMLVDKCPSYKPDVLFFLSTIYASLGEDELAVRYAEKFLEQPERERGYDVEANKMLESVRLKLNFKENPVPYDPKPAKGVNTRFDEYLAALSPDGTQLFFTRRSKKVDKYAGPAGTAREVEEFTWATLLPHAMLEVVNFTEGEVLTSPFNQNYNEGAPSITADNRTLVFASCEVDPKTGEQMCDLFYTTFSHGYWNGIRPFPKGINTEFWEGQPSITPNGDAIYFASNRPGGYGGLDIYKSTLGKDGEWGQPVNLGPVINSRENEKSPFIHPDSKSLYFASEGHPGFGGYDLYKSSHNNGSWDKPMNLGYPINNGKDQVGLKVTLDGSKAYFSSNKLNKAMGWDIYFFDLYAAVQPDEVVLVTGAVEVDPYAFSEPKLILENVATGEEKEMKVNEDDGTFAAVVRKEESNDLVIRLDAKNISFMAEPLNQEVTRDLRMVQRVLEPNVEYELQNVLFETNSDELDPASRAIIQSFARYMERHPNLVVEIQGHTDHNGNDAANLDLSRRRAKRVAEELIRLGINAARITHKGYGETKPVATNDTEEGRAQNRRTVFVVKKM